MHRRDFLRGLAASALLRSLPGVGEEAQAWERCRDFIEAGDGSLRSVIELLPPPTKILSGPLAGLPMLLKDNLATLQGSTSAGSLALADCRTPFESRVAQRLRESGAVIVGKANMSEWANARSDDGISGWSARGGQCRNPHDLTRSPSGSSSGSAAAVAMGFVPAAIGTETVGSIVGPSGACGVVGIKPTWGMVSGEGIIPIAESFDTAGPIALSVSLAARVLQAIAEKPVDLISGLRKDALRGARIGVARNYFGFDHRVDALMEAQLTVLSKLGAKIVDPVQVPAWRDFGGDASTVLRYEFKAGVNAFLARMPASFPIRSIKDVLLFNRQSTRERLDLFGQELILESEKCGPLTEPRYRKALAGARRRSRQEGLDPVFQKYNLDAVVSPTNGPAWVIDEIAGDHFAGGSAPAAAIAGYPHVTVPAGTVLGMPIGLSFYSPAWTEPRLLGFAYAYEQATQALVHPKGFAL